MARATSSLPVPLSPVMSTGNVWSATRPMALYTSCMPGPVNYNDLMLPEDRPATREAVFTALRERRMYDDEHRIRHKDGSARWIWSRGHAVFAPDGALRFLEGWNLDITPRKQAEERLP